MSVDEIVKLQPGNIEQLEVLLSQDGLPTQDCVEQMQHFYGIFDAGELIAAGGLEPADNCALLRSVVVRKPYRGTGLARKLVEYLLEQAETEGRPAVYLLTETAETYFEKLGFMPLARAAVPEAIRQTRQFSSLCPDSASCMVMTLPR